MKHDITAEELLTAIRRHCLECSGGSVKNVEGCRIKHCDLYAYRSKEAMGIGKKITKLKGQISAFDLLQAK